MIRLAISNLSWEAEHDDIMFPFLYDHGVDLEVAPSRILEWKERKVSKRPVSPLERFDEAEDWYRIVHTHYNLQVASMQSLLYNIHENLFASATYRRFLTDYLEQAIRFAVSIHCRNLCFGSAPNRVIPEGMSAETAREIALEFFGHLAQTAAQNDVALAIEPLPASYGTNFINTTKEAFTFAREIDSPGLLVNVDLGTIIENKEDIREIFTGEHLPLISHVHLSEPHLAPLQKRELFQETILLLQEIGYEHYVSMEMLKFPEVRLIQGAVNYFRGILKESCPKES